MRDGDGLVIGVDLGGTKINAAAVDANGEVLAERRTKTLADEGPGPVIGRIASLVAELAAELGGGPDDVQAISIGVPGGVDEALGVVDKAPNLGWENVPLAAQLGEALGTRARIFLDNDVRVAVLGEHAYGVGRGTRTMVGIFVGTGIGGGLIVDGKLHLGSRGAAGELGHMVLVPKGPRCSCGNRGDVEALASRTAMERDVRAYGKSETRRILKTEGRLTSSVVERALAEGCPVMKKVFRRAQKYIGLLVANVVNAIDPEVVVIGGGLAERLGEDMVGRIRDVAYERFLLQRDRERVRIEATTLKDRAAPLGAAFLARQRLRPTGQSTAPSIQPRA